MLDLVLTLALCAQTGPTMRVAEQKRPDIALPQPPMTPVQKRFELEPAGPARVDWEPVRAELGEEGGRPLVFTGDAQNGPTAAIVPAPARRAKGVPVDLVNGELRLAVVDLQVPGRGIPFIWARTYTSRSDFDHGLGRNWDFTYNRRVVVHADGSASVIDGLGREDVYRGDGSSFAPPSGIFATLVRNQDDTFTQLNPAGVRFEYDTSGFLVGMADRAGNALTIERNAFHNPVSITDTQDRVYTLNYTDATPAQRIASLTDFAGREIVYTYDQGDLVRVRSPLVVGTPNGNDFPAGKTTLYSYSTGLGDPRLNHNLLSVVDPRFNVADDPNLSSARLTLTYGTVRGERDRVLTARVGHDQGGPPSDPNRVVGGTWSFAYPAPGETRITDPAGNEKTVLSDPRRRVVEFVEKTNLGIRPGEGDYSTTYSYTTGNLLAACTFPRGNEVRYVYDSSSPLIRSRGNLLEVRHVANGVGGGATDLVTRFTYERVFNQPRTVTDPRAFPTGAVPLDVDGELDLADLLVARYTRTNLFDFQEGTGFQAATGVPPDERVPEGLGDLNNAADFDAGNVVRVDSPVIQTAGPNSGDAARRTATYNAFGQPLDLADPLGEIVTLSYFPSNGVPGDAADMEGYLQAVTLDSNGLALTTTYAYDPMGNVTSIVDPRGAQVDLSVNDLNQVVRVESRPPSAGPRYRADFFYDANDRRIQVEFENRDENGNFYAHSPVVHTYEYDILDLMRIVRADASRNDDPGLVEAVTQYDYDANLNRTAVRPPLAVSDAEPQNNLTTLYDERDLPYRVTRGDDDTDPFDAPPADAVVLTLNYDANGNLLELVDALRHAVHPAAPVTVFPGSAPGDVTRYVYDGFDRRVSVTDPEGSVSTLVLDAASNPAQRTQSGPIDHQPAAPTAVLRQTNVLYDELNRFVTIDERHFDTTTGLDIGDGHRVTTYEYDLDSKLIRVTDDRGLQTTTIWDGADRVSKVVDALNNEFEYAYDFNGNLTQITQRDVSTDLGSLPDVFVTTYVYDSLDRRTQTITPAGDVIDFFYDSRNNAVRISDAVRGAGHPNGPGNVTRYAYDALDRLVRTTRDLTANGRGDTAITGSIVTLQAWDDNSRLSSKTDDNGHTTTYVYDALDRRIRTDYADGTSRSRSFDVDSNVAQTTDQNGTVCQLTYDGLDRLLTRSVTAFGPGVGGTTAELFGYDGVSRLTLASSQDAFGTHPVTLRWDSLDNLARENQNGHLVDAVHDGVGNRTGLTYPGKFGGGRRSFNMTYDALNRVRAITNSRVATFHYKGTQRIEQRTYGDELSPVSQLDVTYDSLPRVTGMAHEAGGIPFLEFHYGYDRAHHRLFEKSEHDGGFGTVYTYDSIYRITRSLEDVDLTAVAQGEEILAESFASPTGQELTYDGMGSRLDSTETMLGIPTTTIYQQDPGDQEVHQYTWIQEGANPPEFLDHDDNGNLVSKGTLNLTYDFKNRLIEVADGAPMVSYSYDALDRRFLRVDFMAAEETRFLFDGDRCVEERNLFGDVIRQYVWTPGIGTLLQESTGTATYFAHENAVGNVIALTDDLGFLLEEYEYDAFGRRTITLDGGTDNEIGFQGARLDPDTGLYLIGARFYDPVLGRFLQREPDGMWTNPVNLGNGYTFDGNDGVNGEVVLVLDPIPIGRLCGTGYLMMQDARSRSVPADARLPQWPVGRTCGSYGQWLAEERRSRAHAGSPTGTGSIGGIPTPAELDVLRSKFIEEFGRDWGEPDPGASVPVTVTDPGRGTTQSTGPGSPGGVIPDSETEELAREFRERYGRDWGDYDPGDSFPAGNPYGTDDTPYFEPGRVPPGGPDTFVPDHINPLTGKPFGLGAHAAEQMIEIWFWFWDKIMGIAAPPYVPSAGDIRQLCEDTHAHGWEIAIINFIKGKSDFFGLGTGFLSELFFDWVRSFFED